MTQSFRILVQSALLALAMGSSLLYAADSQHSDYQNHSPLKLHLNAGKKWATDEVLRTGMETLRNSFADRREAIHKGTLSSEEYKALGAKVDTEASNIVAQCKLDPEADAMLHVILARLLSASDVMQGKAKGAQASGAQSAIAALNSYGRYFDHPQWQPLQ